MKIQFIDDCRLWYRKWSTWLAAAYATATAYVLANPTILFGVIDRIPEPWHTLAATGVGVLLFAAPVLAASLKQKSLAKPDGDQ